MRFFVLLSLLCLLATVAWNQDPNVNVNSRYTVESVDLPAKYEAKLTKELRERLEDCIGILREELESKEGTKGTWWLYEGGELVCHTSYALALPPEDLREQQLAGIAQLRKEWQGVGKGMITEADFKQLVGESFSGANWD